MPKSTGRTRLSVAAVFVAVAVVCPAYPKAGSGHGSASCGSGGHGGAGHMAAHGCHPGNRTSHHAYGGTIEHFHGGAMTSYGMEYDHGTSEIDRELHERVVRTQKAKDAFMSGHPCPVNGATTGACPGCVIECIDPDPADPGHCLDVSNLEWRCVRQ